MRLQLEHPVHCSDGPVGELVDILVDPAAQSVTHIAVEPHHRHWQARLVPIDLVAGEHDDFEHGGRLVLRCTLDEAATLPHVEQSTEIPLGEEKPEPPPGWEVGADGVLLQPSEHPEHAFDDPTVLATYDRIPQGRIEIRRASDVRSADDHHVGRVAGVLVDAGGRVTDLVVESGHLLDRHATVVPIASVSELRSDVIRLALAKDELASM